MPLPMTSTSVSISLWRGVMNPLDRIEGHEPGADHAHGKRRIVGNDPAMLVLLGDQRNSGAALRRVHERSAQALRADPGVIGERGPMEHANSRLPRECRDAFRSADTGDE